jgi:hypothetical protein
MGISDSTAFRYSHPEEIIDKDNMAKNSTLRVGVISRRI